MKVNAWIEYGDWGYVATRLLWLHQSTLDAPVHTHRTIELFLKVFLVSHKVPVSSKGPNWGHKLEDLRTACASHDNNFNNKEFSRRVKYLQKYFDLVRYPTDLQGKLKDGSGIWLTTDVLNVLDEMVAFIRPRIVAEESEWAITPVNSLCANKKSKRPIQAKQRQALIKQNRLIRTIACKNTCAPIVSFDPEFHFDRTWC